MWEFKCNESNEMNVFGNRKAITISGNKPNGLSIKRDDAGVPHIHAKDFNGALWGSGYAHSIDRYSQLLMMRILGQGRLCELLSDDDESLAIDTFFRRANWHNNLDAELAKLDETTLILCQSYCDGINAGFKAKKISALKLLGYIPETWTIQDTILLSRMASYLTLAQSQAEIEHFLIELVQSGLSFEKLAELFPIDEKTFDRKLIESVHLQEKIVPNEVIWNKALPRMMASNNWVIAGNKTKSGQAIMANDPHLEVNRLPNVWCEQSLNWQGGHIKGMGMPGLPGVVVGRTSNLAWGATYTFMDTIDSWIEECDFGSFKIKGDDQEEEWKKFTQRVELIKRKKHPEHSVTFYENDHGVLDGNPYKKNRYLCTRWIAAESGAKSLIASLKMADAKNAKQAMTYLGAFESAWNWVIADKNNNIAYQMSGLMPIRKNNWNGFTPAPGWDVSYDWQGIVDSKDLPRCYNPEEGFIVTANQDLNHLGKVNPINMPMGNYRAARISEQLEKSDHHDVAFCKELQFDVYSKQAKLFLAILLPLLEKENEKSKGAEILKTWDCCYTFDSTATAIFESFYQVLRNKVFGSESSTMGDKVVRHLCEQTGIFIDFYQNFDKVLLNKDSVWFTNISRDKTFLAAFEEAKRLFTYKTWREVNKITFKNLLFQGKLPKVLGFDEMDVPLLGGRATPHQGQIYRSGGRETSFSPSMRLIASMDEEILHTCLAGGPSDNRFSIWYKSELQAWLTGKYKTLS